MTNIRKTDRVIQTWWQRVNEAKAIYEARWMWLSLQRVDSDLYQAMMEQLDIFDQETITGTAEDVIEHGEATLRGFAKVMETMEEAEIADTSYQVGCCPLTGLKIAIGSAKGSTKRVREVYGQDVVFYSPDEIATMIAMRGDCESKAIVFVEAVKKTFPGAEIIAKRYAEEGT